MEEDSPNRRGRSLTDAGFQVEKLLGVAGPAWFMNRFQGHWDVPDKRALLMDLLRTVEKPHILGVSAHPLGIGRK